MTGVPWELSTMQRLRFLVTLTLALLVIASCTQPSEPAPAETPVADTAQPQEDVQATILALEKEWVDAIVNKDTATVDRLLADDFVGTSPTAHYYYKDMALDDLASGRLTVTSMDLDEASVNVYGNTAIAFSSQEEVSTYGGEDTSGHYHYTDVWIRQDGEWKCVASHGTRYNEPH
jgi:ketosteroid isomerase-like protein